MKKIVYSTKEYDFASLVKDWFNVNDLTDLHKFSDYEKIFSREKDQSSKWHKIFYDKIRNDSLFLDTYEKFLTNVIKPINKGKIV